MNDDEDDDVYLFLSVTIDHRVSSSDVTGSPPRLGRVTGSPDQVRPRAWLRLRHPMCGGWSPASREADTERGTQ